MAQNYKVGAHKTSIYTEDGFTRVIYHNTAVVKFNQDKIILDSGGYETNTTKLRMNQTSNQFDLNFQVYQENWIWYVDWKGKTYYFQDKMILNIALDLVTTETGMPIRDIWQLEPTERA